MHTYDKVRDHSASTNEPLAPLFASVAKLEEERISRTDMADSQNPPNTATTTASAPATVPPALDIATPAVAPVSNGKATPTPIAAANQGAAPAATPEGNIDLVAAAANAAAVARPQVAPTVIPGNATGATETVTMVFPHPVLLTIDHSTQLQFGKGTQEVPAIYADHPYLKANKVERYNRNSDLQNGFPATMPAKESPFCPNCGQPSALHVGPLRACPVPKPAAAPTTPAKTGK